MLKSKFINLSKKDPISMLQSAHRGRKQWLPFCRGHSKKAILVQWYLYVDSTVTSILPKDAVDNKPAVVPTMAWRRTGGKTIFLYGGVYLRVYASLSLDWSTSENLISENKRRQRKEDKDTTCHHTDIKKWTFTIDLGKSVIEEPLYLTLLKPTEI